MDARSLFHRALARRFVDAEPDVGWSQTRARVVSPTHGADAGTTSATISASFLGRSHCTSPVSMFQ